MFLVRTNRRPWVLGTLALLGASLGLAADPASDVPPSRPESSTTVHAVLVGGESDVPFASLTELTVEAVVDQVLARNPSLSQMIAAWQAASARYPQVTALEDPMFLYAMAPATIDSRNVQDFGYRVEVSQKFPWCGKRALRGQGALAEASAARSDVEDMRLQLIEGARLAFYDYYLVGRALAVNTENLKLLREFRTTAETRYRTGLVTLQDQLQAEVEIGRQQERQVALERMRSVSMARLNTLMHRSPAALLPSPPEKIELPGTLPEVAVLLAQAQAQRPDLRALVDRLGADRTAVALAHKEYGPDVEVMAAYDTMMGNGPMRDLAPQVGVRVNLPLWQKKRLAGVAEAEARLAQRQAEWARRVDEVHFEVQQAFEQVRQSDRTVALYDKTILPAARANVQAARSAYETGKIPFLSLIEAQRNQVMLRDRFYEALADAWRYRATLQRATGEPMPPATKSIP